MPDAAAFPTPEERAAARQLLEQSRAELQALYHKVLPQQWAAAAGGWSVAGILEHLAIVEQRSTTLLQRMLGEPPHPEWQALREKEPTLASTAEPTHKIEAPPVLHPTGAAPQDSLATFEQWRAAKLALLDQPDMPLHQHARPHPVLGPLTAYQWLLVTAHHTRRHLDQIRRTLA